MSKPIPAVEFLVQEELPESPVFAAFGGDSFLKRQAVLRIRHAMCGGDAGGEDADFSFTSFDGDKAEWRDVLGELSTVAMFGPGKRVVSVDNADAFVTRFRPNLEDYVAKPAASGVLILSLDAFPSNTRLYKAVAAEGTLVDCSAPAESKLPKWLVDWAKNHHDLMLPLAGADLLVETIGPELGLIDQELAKLAGAADKNRKVTVDMVHQMVGGWRTKTTWDMLDAALDGNVADALVQLDRLLLSGEQPVGLLGQISASLRRFAAATRLVLQAESTGRRIVLRDVLEQAGVRSFVLQKAERQLRRIGRRRGSQIYRWLLDADLDLKGNSQLDPRVLLERLLIRIAAPE